MGLCDLCCLRMPFPDFNFIQATEYKKVTQATHIFTFDS
jgi:hypothetical protein